MNRRFRFPAATHFHRPDRSVLPIVLGLGLAGSALAGNGRPEFPLSVAEARDRAEARFQTLDADRSGGLSREELPDPSRRLEAMDSDGDGTVTREEARAHRQSHGKRTS